MNAQILPFNGTSGWAGSKASKDRQMFLDETGKTGERQQLVLAELQDAGRHGATWKDIALALELHHGQASGVLSVLHRAGLIARLEQRRNKCSIYVLPEFVAGRETADSSKTRASINENALRAIRTLHSETIESDITGKTYCKECQYEWPCDTIKLAGFEDA
jgi:DNA-binding MarR family transcriptional regulator